MQGRMVAVVAALGALLGAGVADAREPAPSGAGTPGGGTLTVGVSVDRFAVSGRRLVARGQVRARLSGGGGAQAATQPVALAVQAPRGRCRVLNLRLEDLQLELLGLKVDLSTTNLRIRGVTRGEESGVLGRLFCRLARSTIRVGSRGAAAQDRRIVRTLNSRLARRPLRAFRAVTTVGPGVGTAQAPAPQCRVLTLVLGPLDLNLLGLVVELYGPTNTRPVTLTITAFRGQGALGDLFCGLSAGSP